MAQATNLLTLEGRIALVTGAGRGVGAATARQLARAGAHVAVVDRDGAGAARTAQEIGLAGGDALHFEGDVTDAFAMERIVDRVVDDWGRLDVLVNNAGLYRQTPLEDVSDADWHDILDVNLRATMVCTAAAVRHMLKRGSGRILSAASIVARQGFAGVTAYAAAKAGVIGMTRVWARELGPKGITANAVAPGFVQSELLRSIPDEVMADITARIPAGRLGTVEEVAAVYLFLASDLASFINGAVVGVDGGLLM